MKGYDKNIESSYVQYWGVNNLYDLAMSQNLPVNNFEWIKDIPQFNEDFIKNNNNQNDKGYFFEVVAQYTKNYMNFIPILPGRMKIEKLAANLPNKTEYVIHIKKLKQAINHGLFLKKAHRVIKFNQNA